VWALVGYEKERRKLAGALGIWNLILGICILKNNPKYLRWMLAVIGLSVSSAAFRGTAVVKLR